MRAGAAERRPWLGSATPPKTRRAASGGPQWVSVRGFGGGVGGVSYHGNP